MKQRRSRSLEKTGVAVVLALLMLALVMAPMAVEAKKKPTFPPNPTLVQILDRLPHGRPFQLLAKAILFVDQQVAALQAEVDELQQQVAALLARVQATTINSGFGTTPVLSNQAPATAHVRLEVSFFRNDATPAGAGLSHIIYATVSVASPTEINFISAGNDGVQTANSATLSATPAVIASIAGIADLVAISDTEGATFQLREQGTVSGVYFVKINK